MSLNFIMQNMMNATNTMSGGGKGGSVNTGMLFAIVLVAFFIRVWIVQIAYNNIVPKLVMSLSEEPAKILSHYSSLSFVDAIFLTLVVSSLVGN